MESPPPSPPPSPSPTPSPPSSSSESSPEITPPPPPQQPPQPTNSREKSSSEVLIRCSITLGFMITSIISITYAFGFFTLLFSIPPSISLPSQCKILSTSVDLRSSKICELGLLNYKAKRVFYPSERRKFRCRYDYYWASIFKVEYRDHFSGQTLLGLSEAPKEALPSDCRPNFSTAWLTKHVLKVNETYDCWYTSGRSKVEIFQESYFGCQAKDPSLSEMMRRYSILFTKVMQSLWSTQMKFKRTGLLAVLLGAIGGFLTAMVSFTVVVVCGRFFCSFAKATTRMIVSQLNRVILSRMFFFVAYFSVVGWLAIQYGKFLGLRELFVDN